MKVAAPTKSVTIIRDLLGLDLKNGLLVRMISTTIDAETTDSMNHPVLNCPTVACKRKSRTPKVTKSNMEDTRPKTIMKFLMNPIDQRLG
jgi:hypothetical protein